MTKLDLEMTKDLMSKLDIVLKQFAEENDLKKIVIKTTKYDSSNGEIKANIHMEIKQSEEEEISKFEMESMIIGLAPDSYGKKITVQGREFTIVEIKRQNRKFPIIAIDENGGRYKFAVDLVNEKVLDI